MPLICITAVVIINHCCSNPFQEYIDGCGDLKTSISKVMRRAFMDPKETTTDGRGNRIVTKTGGNHTSLDNELHGLWENRNSSPKVLMARLS